MIKLINSKFEDFNFQNIKDIKLSFLDPPDNTRIKYENYKDNLKKDDYINLLEIWTHKACSITDGPVFISIAEQWIPYMEKIVMDNNITLVQRLFWYYTFGQASQKKYTSSVRPIYWLNNNIIYDDEIRIPSQRIIKYNDKRGNPKGKLPDNVWNFSRVAGTFKERRSFHPCQHPEALLERIILGHSKVNETILDPFVGSGTTAIVSKRLNRNFIGLDVSQFYLNKISEKMGNDQ